MADLTLTDDEQSALRATVAVEPGWDDVVPGTRLLAHLPVLVTCDLVVLAYLDEHGVTVAEEHRPRGAGVPLGANRLGVVVRNGTDHIAQLWLIRRDPAFTARERAVLALVTPALERVLREPPHTGMSGQLTAQEHRVLQHVASGMTNSEVARMLYVAPSTVRKHLEHAYRKLGVSNRFAAVHALAGSERPESERQRPFAGVGVTEAPVLPVVSRALS